MRYFLSLGSNINAQKNIEFAVSELSKIFSDLNSSSIHKTKAEGFEGEDFLNSVISVSYTHLTLPTICSV